MGRRRRQYTDEFKEEAVKLVLEEGMRICQVARDLGISESVLGRWVKLAREAQGTADEQALEISEREELERLRQEVAILRKERAILKKAAAFFAQESL